MHAGLPRSGPHEKCASGVLSAASRPPQARDLGKVAGRGRCQKWYFGCHVSERVSAPACLAPVTKTKGASAASDLPWSGILRPRRPSASPSGSGKAKPDVEAGGEDPRPPTLAGQMRRCGDNRTPTRSVVYTGPECSAVATTSEAERAEAASSYRDVGAGDGCGPGALGAPRRPRVRGGSAPRA
jgi:hypothetical protein